MGIQTQRELIDRGRWNILGLISAVTGYIDMQMRPSAHLRIYHCSSAVEPS